MSNVDYLTGPAVWHDRLSVSG